MTPYFSLFALLLLFSSPGCLHSEEAAFEGFKLWPKKMHMLEMKEMRATFKNDDQSKMEESVSMEDVAEGNVAPPQMEQRQSSEEQRETNRIKRETGSHSSHGSFPLESSESAEDCKGVKQCNPQQHDMPRHASKRQTSITGNGNRLSNLINLPVKLNVLANVLSKLNEGVLDPIEQPSSNSVTIKGNDNTISSLVNAPIDADAVVNILSQVDSTKAGSKGSNAHGGGVVDGLLGGLLGGGGGGASKGGKGLVGGLLDGVLGDGSGSGLLGGLLGDTLGDLLGALLGGKGLVGTLLGGVDGKGLVTELVDNLLGGVVGLVENLLELLLGLLDGLLLGMDSTAVGVGGHASEGLNIKGNNNHVSSLVNAPIRIKALINILSSLKEELKQQVHPAAAGSHHGTNIKGNNNELSSLINLPLDLNLDLNVLSSSTKTGRGEREANATGKPASEAALVDTLVATPPKTSQPVTIPASEAGGTNIHGNDNIVSSLLNVVPDINLNLNVLSEVTDLLVGSDAASGVEAGSNPNEICFDVPVSEADTSITGNNNQVSNAINIKPKINLDLNLLSKVKETGGFKGPTQRVCIIRPTKGSPGPKPTVKPTMKPPVKPTAKPTTAPSMKPPTTPPPSSSNEICFNILVDSSSGTVVKGNNNKVNSLLNLEPNINLDLNLLSNVQQQTHAPSNIVVKRICIPRPAAPTPPPIMPPPVIPHFPPAPSRCFRRTCASWRQFVDYDCLNTPNDYPKYTFARDI